VLKTGDFMFVSVVMQEDKWLQLVGLHHMSVRHLEYARFDIFPVDGQGVDFPQTGWARSPQVRCVLGAAAACLSFTCFSMHGGSAQELCCWESMLRVRPIDPLWPLCVCAQGGQQVVVQAGMVAAEAEAGMGAAEDFRF